LQRIINAGGYSIKGIVSTYQSEAAFRQELWLLAVAIPLALWIGSSLL
jgi:diacylglycerol kinase (ATP)